MATTNQLVDKVNSQVASINRSTGGAMPQLTPLTPITPSSLSENVQPADVTPAVDATAPTQFQEQVSQPQGDFAQQQQQKTEQAGTMATQSFEDYVNAVIETPGQAQLESEQYQKFNVDNLQAKVKQYDLQIAQEQQRLRRQIERVQQEGGGLKIGAQADIRNAERESIAYQADLGMVRAFAQNDYLAAKQTADRAVDAVSEQNQRYISALKENYQRNQDLFTTSQQREFQVKLADYERKQNFEIKQFELMQSTKLKAMQMAQTNGAPQQVLEAISNSDSIEEVVTQGGQWGATDLLQREQLRASVANSWASAALNDLKLKEAQKAQERLEQSVANGELVLDDDQKEWAIKISKEYENESGEFKKQVGAYNRIIASAQEPSAAGDLALIFNYMKMLDPGSTVREGEFANAQNSAGVPQRVISQYNSILSGQRLSESTRNDFVDRSDLIYEASLDQQMVLEDRYREKATTLLGLPPEAANYVVQDIRATGSLTETAFALKFDQMSTDQLQLLINEGLIPNSTTSYGAQ